MKWRTETWDEQKARLQKWHKWFAWHPVIIKEKDGKHYSIWLKNIYRRGVYSVSYSDANWVWYYVETIFDILADKGEGQTEDSEIATSIVAGQIKIDISSNSLQIYDGKKWVTIGTLTVN